MKTILFIALIAIVMTGFAAADANMKIYDIDKNAIIDATERVNLDIDIEHSRISQAEARVIDAYTDSGTLILTDAFQAAFLNPVNTIATTVTVTDAPAPVVVTETPAPVVEEPTVATPPRATDPNMTLMLIVCGVLITGIVLYMVSRNDDEDE